MRYRTRSFVEKYNENGSEIFQIDLVFAESNRIEFGTLSERLNRGIDETSE